MLRVPPGHNDISSNELKDAVSAASERFAINLQKELEETKAFVTSKCVAAAESGKKFAIVNINHVQQSTKETLCKWIVAAGFTCTSTPPDEDGYAISWC